MRLKQIDKELLPKQRLIFRMPTQASLKGIKYSNIISSKQLQRNPSQILFCYKQSDSKFTVLTFEHKCLVNAQTFKVQDMPNKHVTFVKLAELPVKSKLFCVFVLVGYDEGTLEFYDFDQEYAKVKELKHEEDKSQVIDVHLDRQNLSILRQNTMHIYKVGEGLVFNLQKNLILGFEALSFHVGHKYLYLASRSEAQVWERSGSMKCLFKISNVGVRMFYQPQQAQSKCVLLGCDNDTIILLDFSSKTRHVFSGFKSFVVGFVKTVQGLWAFSMDGRAVCLEMNAISNDQQPPAKTDVDLDGSIDKFHTQGIIWATGAGDTIIIYDFDNFVNLYEPNKSVKFSDLYNPDR